VKELKLPKHLAVPLTVLALACLVGQLYDSINGGLLPSRAMSFVQNKYNELRDTSPTTPGAPARAFAMTTGGINEIGHYPPGIETYTRQVGALLRQGADRTALDIPLFNSHGVHLPPAARTSIAIELPENGIYSRISHSPARMDARRPATTIASRFLFQNASIEAQLQPPVIRQINAPEPLIQKHLRGLGLNPAPDSLGRVPLVYGYRTKFVATLPLLIYAEQSGIPLASLRVEKTGQSNYWLLGASGQKQIRIPIDHRGRAQMIFLPGTPKVRTEPLMESVRDIVIQNRDLAGQVAFVGGLGENSTTHSASIYNAIAKEQFARPAGLGMQVGIVASVALLLMGCLSLLRLSNRPLPGRRVAMIFAAAGLGLFHGASELIQINGTVVSTFWPLVFIAGTIATVLIIRAHERLSVWMHRRGLDSPNRVKYLMQHPELLKKEPEAHEVTVFTLNVANFSAVNRSRNPEEAFFQLETLTDHVRELAFQFGGSIDVQYGDTITGMFGVDQNPEHAVEAVEFAMAVHLKIGDLNRHWEEKGYPRFKVRVGIATGPVLMGYRSASGQRKLQALGDAMSVSRALMRRSEPGETLVATSTRTKVYQDFQLREEHFPVGGGRKIRAWKVCGYGGADAVRVTSDRIKVG
jgi:class 3 adenylate cyclase